MKRSWLHIHNSSWFPNHEILWEKFLLHTKKLGKINLQPRMVILRPTPISLCLEELINDVIKCTSAFVARCVAFYFHPCIYITYPHKWNLINFMKRYITLWWIWYNHVFIEYARETLEHSLKCLGLACTKILCTIYEAYFIIFTCSLNRTRITFPCGAITHHVLLISRQTTHYNY